MTNSTDNQHSTIAQRLGRWAVPFAVILAATTMGSAHATQSPGDVGAFDPGVVCSSSVPAGTSTSTDEQIRLSRLVIDAHAASVHAIR